MNKFVTKVLAGIMTLAVVTSSVAAADPMTASAKVKIKKIKVTAPSGKPAYVAKGKKVKLTTTVTTKPNKKANKKVTYKSANKKIATVSKKGVVKGKKAGSTKITVTSKKNKKKKTTIRVIVKKAAVKKVNLNSSNFSLSPGGSKTLKATVTPKNNTYTKVAWSTSNKSVATVSSKGVVKAKKEGTAKITAKALDGSGKKASVTVTVGTGIASVTAVTSSLLRVTLTGQKALKARDFVAQGKSGATATEYLTLEVLSVRTTDQRVYDVHILGKLVAGDYVKVTIPALTGNKSLEIYIENISDYGDAGNEKVYYHTGTKEELFAEMWTWGYPEYSNTNKVGNVMIKSVTGLPNGLKAYISKDRAFVVVRGHFTDTYAGNVSAVVTGTDEKGTVFTQRHIFVVGSENQIVAVAKPADTQLAYIPDNPDTPDKDESSGFELSKSKICYDYIIAAGGSGEYISKVTCKGKDVNELIYTDYTVDEEGNPSHGGRAAIKAGTYDFEVMLTDYDNDSLTTTTKVTMNLIDGVTVSGTVRDADGQPVMYSHIEGYTKTDAYGRMQSVSADADAKGTYSVRVVPGDYYTSCNEGYDVTVGNLFKANTTKDFVYPFHKVTFATNISGVKAYDYNGHSVPCVTDSYGTISTLWFNLYDDIENKDFGMWAYLRPGSYEILTYPNTDKYKDINFIYAYGKVEEATDSETQRKYFVPEDYLGCYELSGSFTVSGRSTVTLNTTKIADNE